MGEKGFTLIEMLLVVAIIGFLVAILIPSVGGFGASAKEKAAKADIRQLKSALEVYFISFSVYPPDGATWGTKDSALVKADGTAGYERIVDQFPIDTYDTAASPGTYQYDVDGNTYVITSRRDAAGAPTANDALDKAELNGATIYATNARDVSG